MNKIFTGDALEVLKTLEDESVQTCVTSPPYFGLRDYGHEGQIGLEDTPEAYVEKLVELFREVKRVLRDDGTLWLNLGDSYGSKQLLGIPWRVAFALQADGWYLRQDIIWSKPNPMPESVTDRCTKAHEYIFLLSKSPKYYFDSVAIAEPAVTNEGRPSGVVREREYSYDSKPNRNPKAYMRVNAGKAFADAQGKYGATRPVGRTCNTRTDGMRNKRSVWTVNTKPYKGAHFATFPATLIEPCILAGASKGGVVLDPFFGSGTTGAVANALGREYIGIEINPAYVALAEKRLSEVQPRLLIS